MVPLAAMPSSSAKTRPAGDSGDARLGLGVGHAALGKTGLDLLAAIGESLVPGLGVGLDQAHGETPIGEGERDAPAHGAAADHRDIGDLPSGQALGQVGHPARFALGEEHVAERAMLGRLDATVEDRDLGLEAFIEG